MNRYGQQIRKPFSGGAIEALLVLPIREPPYEYGQIPVFVGGWQ